MVLILFGASIEPPRGRRRFKVLLRIGDDPFVQGVRMGTKLDQAGTLHLVNLIGGEKILTQDFRVAVVHGRVRVPGLREPRTDQADDGWIVKGLQQRVHSCVDTFQAIVKAEQHRVRR